MTVLSPCRAAICAQSRGPGQALGSSTVKDMEHVVLRGRKPIRLEYLFKTVDVCRDSSPEGDCDFLMERGAWELARGGRFANWHGITMHVITNVVKPLPI